MEIKNSYNFQNTIQTVLPDTIASEIGLEEGDQLISINGQKIKDVIDYRFLIHDEQIELEIEKKSGEVIIFDIEKDYDEDLGLDFSNPLIDHAKSCSNHCVFCFIDQLPKNLRSTLYFKDDDSRLSFLQGNFITLTNMSQDEINRMIQYRISPVNVSIHTTNPNLRRRMLGHREAGKILDTLKRFHEANLEINGQIVLIPEMNDGEELDRTMEDLYNLYPTLQSVAIVPVGLTRHRKNLFPLREFRENELLKVIDQVEKMQKKCLETIGTRLFFLSDEFYLKAKRSLPSEEAYEGYPQIENGVGMTRSFLEEVYQGIQKHKNKLNKKISGKKVTIAFVTSTLSKETMLKVKAWLESAISNLAIEVYPVKNNFFGQSVNVSGLLTGYDVLDQLKGVQADAIMLPRNMFREDMLITLDDQTDESLSKQLKQEIYLGPWDGFKFINELEKVIDNE